MFFWNYLAFSMIQQMLAICSLVPLPFLPFISVEGKGMHRSAQKPTGMQQKGVKEVWEQLEEKYNKPRNKGEARGCGEQTRDDFMMTLDAF